MENGSILRTSSSGTERFTPTDFKAATANIRRLEELTLDNKIQKQHTPDELFQLRAKEQGKIRQAFQKADRAFNLLAVATGPTSDNKELAELVVIRLQLIKAMERPLDETILPPSVRGRLKLQRAFHNKEEWQRLAHTADSLDVDQSTGRSFYWSDFTIPDLVAAFNDSQEGRFGRKRLREVLWQVFEDFLQAKAWSPEHLDSIKILAAAHDSELVRRLFDTMLKRISGSLLLSPALVESFGEMIRYTNQRITGPNGKIDPKEEKPKFRTALNENDIIQILNILTKSIIQLREAPSTQDLLVRLLRALCNMLNSCVDQKLCENSQAIKMNTDEASELSKLLRELSSDEEDRDPDVRFYAWYAREALARLPDEDSKLSQYLGCAVDIGKGVYSLASNIAAAASGFDIEALFEVGNSVLELKESIEKTIDVVNRGMKDASYEALRWLETLVPKKMNEARAWYAGLTACATSLTKKKGQVKASPWLTYGIIVAWLPTLSASTTGLHRMALFTMAQGAGVNLLASLRETSVETPEEADAISPVTSPNNAVYKKKGFFSRLKSGKKGSDGPVFSRESQRNLEKMLPSSPQTGKQASLWVPSIATQIKVKSALEGPPPTSHMDTFSLLTGLEIMYRQLLKEGLTRILSQENVSSSAVSKVLGKIGRITDSINAKFEGPNTSIGRDFGESSYLTPLELSQASLQVFSHSCVVSAYRKKLPMLYYQEETIKQQQSLLRGPDTLTALATFVDVRCQDSLQAYQSWISSHELTRVERGAEAQDSDSQDLIKTLNDFIQKQQDDAVILLQGSAGNGKSLSGQKLIGNLQREIIRDRSLLSEQDRPFFPLFVSLGQLKDPTRNCVEQILESSGWDSESVSALKKDIQTRIVLWLDGYDEIKTQTPLYESNDLGSWHSKVIITARLGTLPPNYPRLFRGTGRILQEYYLLPFDGPAVAKYIELRAENDVDPETKRHMSDVSANQLVDDTIKTLNTPDLKALLSLIQTPFLLKIVMDVLPSLQRMSHRIPKLTRAILYSTFLQQWYSREASRVHQLKVKIPKGFDIPASFHRFGEDLAHNLLCANLSAAPIASNVYRTRRERSMDHWSWFFGNEIPENRVARAGVPLKFTATTAQFLHRSLLEYYMASALFQEIMDIYRLSMNQREQEAATRLGPESLLNSLHDKENRPLLRNEHSIMSFLKDMIEAENPDVISVLWKQVMASQNDPKLSVQGSHAITLLNLLNQPMSGRDLTHVNIAYARLNHALMDNVDLRGADLRGAQLRQVWMRGADLRGADLTDVDFGQLPSIAFDFLSGLATSADGQYLAVGVKSDVVLYDRLTDSVKHTFSGHRNVVQKILFWKKFLISCSGDSTIRLWDVETGLEDGKAMTGHSNKIHDILLYGDILISGGSDETVRYWNLTERKQFAELTGFDASVICLSQDDNLLACVTSNGKGIFIYDVNTRVQLGVQLEGHVSASIKNGILATVCSDGTDADPGKEILIYDLNSRNLLGTLVGHEALVKCLQVTHDGLISGSDDKTIRVWDLKTFQQRGSPFQHESEVTCFSVRGTEIVSGERSAYVRIWNITNQVSLEDPLPGHKGGILSVAVQDDIVVTGGYDKTIMRWNFHTGQSIGQAITGHTGRIMSIVVADGVIASGGGDATIRLWDLKTGLPMGDAIAHDGDVHAMCMQGGCLFVACDGQVPMVIDLATRQPKYEIFNLEIVNLRSVAVAADYIVGGSTGGRSQIWNVSTGEFYGDESTLGQDNGDAVMFLIPWNGRIVQVLYSGWISIWNMSTLKADTFKMSPSPVCTAAAVGGDYILIACKDYTLRMGCLVDKKEENKERKSLLVIRLDCMVTSIAHYKGDWLITLAKRVQRWSYNPQKNEMTLLWSMPNRFPLCLSDCKLDEVRGLTHIQERLFDQRSAINDLKYDVAPILIAQPMNNEVEEDDGDAFMSMGMLDD
eukprot:TRINITY_DN2578_c1_g3_i1.p1 TRINITY_DN2578_c1_g3~~TRINITY_DN2578_c1_g3_i1.p1  ORF type:complete len:1944 (+),score=560.51 TRINITY_DN2578_c1_g3_i1:3114-8945(+)